MRGAKSRRKDESNVTRYTFQEVSETRVPETGHTPLLPGDDEVVNLDLENGWAKGIKVGSRADLERPVLIDLDPIVNPVLFWSGKRSKRRIPLLPLQRSEVVPESKIRQIVDAAKEASLKQQGQKRLTLYFAELEKSLRESDRDRRVDFYTHDGGWKNKLICGDSLLVMESLVRYEGLRGSVQMIYIDPPYGIKYDSNFQQRIDRPRNDEVEGAEDVLTIKAFRDTWELGIHSYLSYLAERLYTARDLLSESGSIFVQIGDTNVHFVRALMDEVFGRENFCSIIGFTKTGGATSSLLDSVMDYLVWYAKDKDQVRYHQLYADKKAGRAGATGYRLVESPDGSEWRTMTPEEFANPEAVQPGWKIFDGTPLISQDFSETRTVPFTYKGRTYTPPGTRHWSLSLEGLQRLGEMNRLLQIGNRLEFRRYLDDFPFTELSNLWTGLGIRGFTGEKLYVVQTDPEVVNRCIAMTTRPGDLVFDPTCGSGTTAYVAERLGRRWITCDTSRVALNIARQRLMSATFDHYKLKGKAVSEDFDYITAKKPSPSSLAYGLEPETVQLVDRPEVVRDVVRVTGPFEVLSIGRYSIEDWKGSFSQQGTVENYITVICRLYRRDATPQTSKGLIHAIVESPRENFAISVGPISGRVTAKQLNDAAQDAVACGLLEVHVLGWAFEANVGEIKSKLEAPGKVKINLVVIRPDTLMEGLKVSQAGTLFSPLSLPDIRVVPKKRESAPTEYAVLLDGVGVFDREKRITEYKKAESGYVSAWYIDEDYDGDCFVDCQMFFDFTRVPNLTRIADAAFDSGEFGLKTESAPFAAGKYRRIAVKVVDVYGNESTIIKSLD